MKNSLNIILALVFVLAFTGTSRAEMFTAYLSGAQEVPANASAATGYARILVNEAALTVQFTVVFNNLSSNQVGAHIHAPAAIGVNGPIAVNLGTPGGTSGTITGSGSITLTQIQQLRQHLGYVNIHSANLPGGEIRGQLGVTRVVDYDGDGRTDPTVVSFPAQTGVAPMTFWIANSTDPVRSTIWGDWNRDDPVPGDWDGDGRCDLAAARLYAGPSAPSEFWITDSSTGNYRYYNWGVAGDLAVQRDYDGDGKTDTAIYRPGAVNGWYILRSATNTVEVRAFGAGDDTPVPGDYDGDGKFDLAVYRISLAPANTLIYTRSSDGVIVYHTFGNFTTDWILPGDYDGDGKYEIAAARTGQFATSPLVWWIALSGGGTRVQTFGISSDLMVQGDYDGDARTDMAVYRQGAATGSPNVFWILQSLTNTARIHQWGVRPNYAVNRFDSR